MPHLVVLSVVLALAAGCTSASAGQAAPDEGERARWGARLESLLEELDRAPEYGDELHRQLQLHPVLLERLYARTAASFSDEDFARRMAAQLAANPAGLRTLMIETFEAARTSEPAQRALVEGIEVRATELASYLDASPELLATLAMRFFEQARHHADKAVRKQIALFERHLSTRRARPRS